MPGIQTKLSVNKPGDRWEQEADRVADAVLAGRISHSISGFAPGQSLMRVADSTAVGDAPASVHDTLMSPGQALDESTKKFMEPRFGHDFGRVRVHTDQRAAESAQDINALAYTAGRHIVFGAGQYSPGTPGGQKLLAHELTHTIQQSAMLPAIQRQESDFVDTVRGTPTETESGVWQGEVDRREFVPASGTEAERTIHTGRVGLVFDQNTCEIRIPFNIQFEHPSASNWPSCSADRGDPVPAEPLDGGRFTELSSEFVRATETWMNGWYTARLDDGCASPCAGRAIPIRVVISTTDPNPNFTVVLANTRGRSCVSGDIITIHARGLDSLTGVSEYRMAHEAGHAILQHGDEYPDSEHPPERVRTDDWSLMSHHDSFRRFSLLHERHFGFVQEFLDVIIPNCHARLEEISRPTVFDFRLRPDIGGVYYEQGWGLYAGIGAELGIPLDRLRAWELTIGPHFSYLSRTSGPARQAFLIGGRVGLEYTTSPSSWGFRAGGFAEAGYGWFDQDVPGGGSFESQETGSAYGELGISAGLDLPPAFIFRPFVGLEAAAGTGLENLDFNDPAQIHWFRLGLSLGLAF